MFIIMILESALNNEQSHIGGCSILPTIIIVIFKKRGLNINKQLGVLEC